MPMGLNSVADNAIPGYSSSQQEQPTLQVSILMIECCIRNTSGGHNPMTERNHFWRFTEARWFLPVFIMLVVLGLLLYDLFGPMLLPINAQHMATTISAIRSRPDAYRQQVVTLSGTVVSAKKNKFTLDDGTGRMEIRGGPPHYQRLNVLVGDRVTVTGQVVSKPRSGDRAPKQHLDACRVVDGAETMAIRDCRFDGPPPWAGKPAKPDRGPAR